MPFPSPGDLHDPGIEPSSPALAGRFFTTELPGKPMFCVCVCVCIKCVSNMILYIYMCVCVCVAAAAKSLQSYPTLCNPIDGSPPGSPVPGILQARTLEWVAISCSNAWKWEVKVKSLSCVRLFVTPWTAAYQAPPSMGFSRQEYWTGVPSPSPIYVFIYIYIYIKH